MNLNMLEELEPRQTTTVRIRRKGEVRENDLIGLHEYRKVCLLWSRSILGITICTSL